MMAPIMAQELSVTVIGAIAREVFEDRMFLNK
jgi:hypothetical protein